MSGEERREAMLRLLAQADAPLSGERLGRELGVSRQVIVQDVALLRSRGAEVLSTPRGYRLAERRPERTLKVRHTPERTREELTCLVDLGCRVEDVTVNHRVYGRITAPLGLASRRDVDRFIGKLESGASSLLMTVTSGYHFHRVSADDAAALDEAEAALERLGMLAERLPYERDLEA